MQFFFQIMIYRCNQSIIVHFFLFMLFLIFGPSSLPIVAAQSDERHENKTAFCVGVV